MISESIEFGLCISVSCLPLGYLKIKNDLWSRFCSKLSDSKNCAFKKFDSFNKLASVDRVIIPVEEFLLNDPESFKLASITGGHGDIPAGDRMQPVSQLIKGKRANQILENLAILDYNGDKKLSPKTALETFFFESVFGSSCRCQHQLLTSVHFLEQRCQHFDDEYYKFILAKDLFLKRLVGYVIRVGTTNLDRIKYFHHLETDTIEALTESRKREISANIRSGYK